MNSTQGLAGIIFTRAFHGFEGQSVSPALTFLLLAVPYADTTAATTVLFE
jgi:hypothetical protein